MWEMLDPPLIPLPLSVTAAAKGFSSGGVSALIPFFLSALEPVSSGAPGGSLYRTSALHHDCLC